MSDITLDEFRNEAIAFLDANAEKKPPAEEFAWGKGSDEVSIFEEVADDEEATLIENAKAWRAKRYDAGFGWIGGPERVRRPRPGHGLRTRLRQRREPVRDPQHSFFGIGLGMVARPSGITPDPRWPPRYLARHLPGRHRWAASSSASPAPAPTWRQLQTRPCATATTGWSTARRSGRSGAHYGDWGDPADPHRPRRAQAQRPHLLHGRHARRRASRSARCAR